MTGNDNRASPKRYGLSRGRIKVADDFDAPLELAEFGMSDKSEVGIEDSDDVSALSRDGRARGDQE